MPRTRVKICGITRPEDAAAAAELGADAIGLVFAERSARYIEPQRAREIVAMLPPFVSTVGLFMDPERDRVGEVLATVRLDWLQFHGHERAELCEAWGVPYVKAVAMGDGIDAARTQIAAYPNSRGFLLDGHRAGEPGGLGRTFDWAALPEIDGRALILAGGLDSANVARAIHAARPHAVDVSSGVETEPGIKDHAKMAAFIDEVEGARD